MLFFTGLPRGKCSRWFRLCAKGKPDSIFISPFKTERGEGREGVIASEMYKPELDPSLKVYIVIELPKHSKKSANQQ